MALLNRIVSRERAAAFAEAMKARMKKNSDKLANKEIKAYEKHFKVRTYQPREKVLVDVRTESHEKKQMRQAKVVKLANGGYYKVEWLEQPNIGKASYVPVDHIEPFRLRQKVYISDDSDDDDDSIEAQKVCWVDDDGDVGEAMEAETHLVELAIESRSNALMPVDAEGNKRSLSYFYQSTYVDDYSEQPRKRFKKATMDL